MDFNEYVRKPFTVQAVQVTTENIDQVAELVGTICTKDDGTPYIQADRRLVPNVLQVYPGFWLTKMGNNVRCYSAKIFNQQFTSMTPEIKGWIDFMHHKDDPTIDDIPTVTE